MKIYADASVYRGVIVALRRRGLDVRSGAEERASAPDPDVLATATELSRILITEDKDFGDLVVRRGLTACGVMNDANKSGGSGGRRRARDRRIAASRRRDHDNH